MKIVRSSKEIYGLSGQWKKTGQTISLVPTMGCLHEGHVSLINYARNESDKVIVSLFVNPMQFGQNEDFDSYPSQFERDRELLEASGADVLFCPPVKEMYSEAFQTSVNVYKLSQGMCGKDRPGHFDGVATVVTKLFNITIPDIAVFGEKDFQQLVIIRQLTEDLSYSIRIIGAPIIREDDGLAMSSRNIYLDSEGRQCALCLYQAVQASKKMLRTHGDVPVETILENTKKIVARAGGKLEYAVIVNEFTLIPDKIINNNSVLALAVKVGDSVRLIDNSKLIS